MILTWMLCALNGLETLCCTRIDVPYIYQKNLIKFGGISRSYGAFMTWKREKRVSLVYNPKNAEKYLHGPGVPHGCAPGQSCKRIVHRIVC